jgi:hypothetical protein
MMVWRQLGTPLNALTQALAGSYRRYGLRFPIPALTPGEIAGLPCQECLLARGGPLSLLVEVVGSGPFKLVIS